MPSPPLDSTTVTALVEDATAAPSMHNAQPWKFRYLSSTGTMQLRADPERTMPKSDPTHRAVHLGCAAALFNLRVAAVHAGREPVTTLLPDPADPWLLAEVTLPNPRALSTISPYSTPLSANGTPAATPSPTRRSRTTSWTGCAAPPCSKAPGCTFPTHGM